MCSRPNLIIHAREKKDLITLDMTPLYKYGTYKCHYKDDSVPFINIPQSEAWTGFLKKDDFKK